MLRNQIVPAIRAIVDENIENTWFQQDGAAPYYGRNVRYYLNEVFVERWIGRKGPIECQLNRQTSHLSLFSIELPKK